jgi:hypothetical protein
MVLIFFDLSIVAVTIMQIELVLLVFKSVPFYLPVIAKNHLLLQTFNEKSIGPYLFTAYYREKFNMQLKIACPVRMTNG